MGNDQETRMGATFEARVTPEEGEWPKRDATPFVPANIFNAMFENLVSDGVVGMKDGRLITADEMYIGQRPAEVTPEMNAAGDEACALHSLGAFAPGVTKQEASYRAMHALAPVELVSPAEIALIRERDIALECANAESRRHGQALLERDEARAERDQLRRAIRNNAAEQEADISALRAELMAAHDKLARQAKALGDAANAIAVLTPRTDPTPDPIANAIRPPAGDQRRIGG